MADGKSFDLHISKPVALWELAISLLFSLTRFKFVDDAISLNIGMYKADASLDSLTHKLSIAEFLPIFSTIPSQAKILLQKPYNH